MALHVASALSSKFVFRMMAMFAATGVFMMLIFCSGFTVFSLSSALKIETVRCSETLLSADGSTRCHNPQVQHHDITCPKIPHCEFYRNNLNYIFRFYIITSIETSGTAMLLDRCRCRMICDVYVSSKAVCAAKTLPQRCVRHSYCAV